MTLAFAKQLDQNDALKSFRKQFLFPTQTGTTPFVYFCGNSLGLQPKKTKSYFTSVLDEWGTLAVDGHFKGRDPWLSFHKQFAPSLAKLAGAKPLEVIAMNTLTTNLHLMLSTFYRPTQKRFTIITEAKSFSSDSYALVSQVKLHGLTPKKIIVEIAPRKGEYCLRTEDVLKQIEKRKGTLALVFLGGVNYYTGQAFDMETITKAAHKVGAKSGFDLAHAIGNIPLSLHKWNVDFAVWCSYKYLNSGPGGIGGCFIHEKHAKNKTLPRLAGWWGHEEKDRFKMKPGFRPIATAEGWQLSNAQVFNMIAHKAALELFDQATIKAIVKKSRAMTTFMEDLIISSCNQKNGYVITIITPPSIDERGSQLSILVSKNGETLFDEISQAGFVVDWRAPNVIRVAPAPLYNTFEEVYNFVSFLATCCMYKK